jgi:hypothetical protein
VLVLLLPGAAPQCLRGRGVSNVGLQGTDNALIEAIYRNLYVHYWLNGVQGQLAMKIFFTTMKKKERAIMNMYE